MGFKCIVKCCRNSYTALEPPNALHRFPTQEKQKNLWAALLGLEIDKLSKQSKICSLHFENIYLISRKCSNGFVSFFLSKNAIPTKLLDADCNEAGIVKEECYDIDVKDELKNNLLLANRMREVNSTWEEIDTMDEEVLSDHYTSVSDPLENCMNVEDDIDIKDELEQNLLRATNLECHNTQVDVPETGFSEILTTGGHLSNVNHFEKLTTNNCLSEPVELINHQLAENECIHSGDEKHVCDVHEKDLTTSHKRIHPDEKPYNCYMCRMKFSTSSELEKHKNNHKKEKRYVCNVCQKQLTSKASLKIHKRIHTNEKPHVCDVCQKGFHQSNNLLRHKLTHMGEKPNVCYVCRKKFSSASELAKHRSIHKEEKRYVCDICQKTFTCESHLKVHKKRIYADNKTYVCDVCLKGFHELIKLVKHKMTHTYEKPYVCDMCDKAFKASGNLKIHKVRSHTSEKPYVCNVCLKGYRTSVDLLKHKRFHTGKKSYVCEVCQMVFNTSSSFVKHKRAHMNGQNHTHTSEQKHTHTAGQNHTHMAAQKQTHTGVQKHTHTGGQKNTHTAGQNHTHMAGQKHILVIFVKKITPK